MELVLPITVGEAAAFAVACFAVLFGLLSSRRGGARAGAVVILSATRHSPASAAVRVGVSLAYLHVVLAVRTC